MTLLDHEPLITCNFSTFQCAILDSDVNISQSAMSSSTTEWGLQSLKQLKIIS